MGGEQCGWLRMIRLVLGNGFCVYVFEILVGFLRVVVRCCEGVCYLRAVMFELISGGGSST